MLLADLLTKVDLDADMLIESGHIEKGAVARAKCEAKIQR